MKKALLFLFTIALLSCGPSASDNAAAEHEKLTKKLEEENKQIQKHIDSIELKASKQRKDNEKYLAALDLLNTLGLSTKEQLVNYLAANDTTRLKLQSYTKEQLKVYNLIQLDSIYKFGRIRYLCPSCSALLSDDDDPPPTPVD